MKGFACELEEREIEKSKLIYHQHQDKNLKRKERKCKVQKSYVMLFSRLLKFSRKKMFYNMCVVRIKKWIDVLIGFMIFGLLVYSLEENY